MESPKSEICVLCGVNRATTRDHVPPRGFFKGSEAGLRLITVPSCSECNNGSSDADELLRAYLSLEAGKPTAAAVALWEKGALKSFRRKTRFRENLAKNTFEVADRSTGRTRLAFAVPVSLVERVIGRVTRGLHFFRTGRILSLDVAVAVNKMNGPVDLHAAYLSSFRLGEVGGDAFRYRWGIAAEDENAGLWVLQFHQNVTYYVQTGAAIDDQVTRTC